MPPTQRIVLIASHFVLFAGFAWAQASYLEFQLLIAAELLLVKLASIPIYPERGWRRHTAYIAKLIPGIAVVMGVVLLAYANVAAQPNEEAIEHLVRTWAQIDSRAFAAFAGWIVVHHAAALWRASRSPDPRLCWTKDRVIESGATGVALFVMIIATVVIALPLVSMLRFFGVEPPVDLILIGMMVIARFAVCLLLATMTDDEVRKMAADPY